MIKKLLPSIAFFSCTTIATATDWEKIDVIVAPYLQPNELLEICIDDDCNSYTYVSWEAQTDSESKKQPKDREKMVDIIDDLIKVANVKGTIKITHKTNTETTNADGSKTKKSTETTIEAEAGNGK